MTHSRPAAESRMVQLSFISLYVILVAMPVTAAFLTGMYAFRGQFLTRLADVLILTVFPVLALQPVLAARIRVLDRFFGLDVVYLVHKTMGMTAGFIYICALFFQTVAGGFLLSWPAIVVAIMLSALVLTAFLYREFGIAYELWRKLHNLLALAVFIMVFLQALETIDQGYRVSLRSMLVLYFLAAMSAYVYHRILGPASRQKRPYVVERVERETHNVWTLTFKPPAGEKGLEYLPGQFQFLTFQGGKGEEHPFTISSSPTLPTVHTATIKESGDFTRHIGKIKSGDLIAIQAPFGRFSYLLHPEEKDIVFIAGGIGITPFMSMLRHMRDSGSDKNILLLYANNKEDDIVFRRELEEILSGSPPLVRVVHVLAAPNESWNGERGRINWPMIEKYVDGKVKDKAFYVCGPPPMMNALITTLIEHGVPSRKVRSERFAL